jgi:hypothetical protein
MRVAFVFTFLLFLLCSKAQLLDTSAAHRYRPALVQISSLEQLKNLDTSTFSLDTQLNNFSNYYSAYDNAYPFLDLGLEGSPIKELLRPTKRKLDFGLGIENMDYYFFDDAFNLYQTDRPFTRLNYSQGEQELIFIEATHTQQIGKRLSYGIDYRRLKNQNFYFGNIANLSRSRMNNLFNTRIYTHYLSKERKYEVVVGYVWNSYRQIVTGGIEDLTTFELQSGQSKLENNNALFTAANNVQTQNEFSISQFFRPWARLQDTSKVYELSRFTNQFYWNTSLKNHRYEFTDEQPDSANYGSNLAAFKDSIYHRALTNAWGYVFNYKGFKLNTALEHRYDRIFLNDTVFSYQNIYANGNARFIYKNKHQIEANARLGLLGYNLGDFDVYGKVKTSLKGMNLEAQLGTQLAESQFMFQQFRSAAFNWGNDFRKISNTYVNGQLILPIKLFKVKASIRSENIINPVYFENNTSQQLNGGVAILRVATQLNYTSNHFGSSTNAVYSASSNQNVIPLPVFSVSQNVYSQFKIFSKKLLIQMGLKTQWFSSFNAYIYNPVLRQWSIHNQRFDAYPVVNPYLNAKVKSFNFGLEFFHSQMQLMGNDYYSSPGYAIMPRVLRINLRWDLSN